jgi:hypothetical protein
MQTEERECGSEPGAFDLASWRTTSPVRTCFKPRCRLSRISYLLLGSRQTHRKLYSKALLTMKVAPTQARIFDVFSSRKLRSWIPSTALHAPICQYCSRVDYRFLECQCHPINMFLGVHPMSATKSPGNKLPQCALDSETCDPANSTGTLRSESSNGDRLLCVASDISSSEAFFCIPDSSVS